LDFSLANILGVISVFIAASLVVWNKVLVQRAFKSLDDKYSGLKESTENECTKLNAHYVDLDNRLREVEKEQVRFKEVEKHVDAEIKQVRADIMREVQIISEQLSAIHKKIETIDTKLDKVKDRRG